jgi:AGCS family alanine or glycine:cation symporter
MLWKGRTHEENADGELTPFNALMTALAATVGTGNIAWVATAIFIGGPGALFWMWMTAMVGMATKFAETMLALKYREVTPEGHVVGGPMYFIKNGLGKKWAWLGALFAFFGAFAGFGIGNMVQSNSISDAIIAAMPASFAQSAPLIASLPNSTMPRIVIAAILLVLIGLVILGGVKRIGQVAGKVVPFMCIVYILASVIVVILNITHVPSLFMHVLKEAFTPTAATGGFAGSSVWLAIRFGVARGIFSNEAGLGSAAMAHATATIKDPVRMGYIGMLGTFIDTIIVCSMTGFAIIVTDSWTSGLTGAALTSAAFESALPGVGKFIVAFSSIFFAFTTILGWCVYSERCVIYLVGDRGLKPFRLVFTLAVPVGVLFNLNTVWLLADTLNALMAVPNLIGLLLLSPVVFKMVKEYHKNEAK